MLNTAFCEECRDDVSYSVFEKPMTGKVKGTEYQYLGKEARCLKCNSIVYVNEILDYNLKKLYDVFRQKNGIISLENIREIPEKYSIGKKPLSLMLGWGEQTFSRYYDGDIPSKQYSDVLMKIYNEPLYYLMLLEEKKDNLKSQIAYEKSKNAVIKLTTEKSSNLSKIEMAVGYFLNKCEDITPLALQKILYYVQGFYFAFYGKFIFSEDCEAWIHGPVYKSVYYKYCNYKFDPIKEDTYFDDSQLTLSEKIIFDSIINYFCCYSGKILENFTHNESPWLEARKDLSPIVPSDIIITKESIGDYFSNIKKQYEMLKPDDICLYSTEMFRRLGCIK